MFQALINILRRSLIAAVICVLSPLSVRGDVSVSAAGTTIYNGASLQLLTGVSGTLNLNYVGNSGVLASGYNPIFVLSGSTYNFSGFSFNSGSVTTLVTFSPLTTTQWSATSGSDDQWETAELEQWSTRSRGPGRFWSRRPKQHRHQRSLFHRCSKFPR